MIRYKRKITIQYLAFSKKHYKGEENEKYECKKISNGVICDVICNLYFT